MKQIILSNIPDDIPEDNFNAISWRTTRRIDTVKSSF